MSFFLKDYPAVKQFVDNEQDFGNADLYNIQTRSKLTMNIEEAYQPRSKNVFPLPYYLIPYNSLFSCHQFPRDRSETLKRLLDHGDAEGASHPFFIHPTTIEFFQSWLGNQFTFIPGEKSPYLATPLSSYRSLLVQKVGHEPFIVKASLLNNIACGSRHIDWASASGQQEFSEAFRRMAGSKSPFFIFEDAAALGIRQNEPIELPSNLQVYFGPRSIHSFGNVIRLLPDRLLDGGVQVMSLVSATSSQPDLKCHLVDVANQIGMDYGDFVLKYIFNPVYEQLLKQIGEHGVIIEPHCQNLMMEFSPDGSPTGNFHYRDFDLTSFDRARVPFKYPDLWLRYIKNRPDRTALNSNLESRMAIIHTLHEHFFGNSILPCLVAGIKCGVITKERIFEILDEMTVILKKDLLNLFPLCSTTFLSCTKQENPKRDILLNISSNEIPCVFSSVQKKPPTDTHLEINLSFTTSKDPKYFQFRDNHFFSLEAGRLSALYWPMNN